MKIPHAWVSPSQSLTWFKAVQAALKRAGFSVPLPALKRCWAQALGHDTWETYVASTAPSILMTRGPDTVPLAEELMAVWVAQTHAGLQEMNKAPGRLATFKRAWAAALGARSWPQVTLALDHFNDDTHRRPLTAKEDREIRRFLAQEARLQAAMA